MRASIGRGWRTANIFSENINLLASSRNVLFTEVLRPEKTLNYGFNIIQKWVQANYEAWFSLDLYRTRFYNQIFPDYNQSQNVAIISNFTGTSISNGLKAEINLDFWQIFNTKLAYNYLDVYREIDNDKVQLPFIPNHKL
ncbi:MAG: TonB-dependent receptor, partial [Bacteroidota bacterium]